MGFYAVLDQVVALLRQRGRVTYRALKREFQLDDACLEDLKDELINAQRVAVDEQAAVLVWTGGPLAAEPRIRPPAEADMQRHFAVTPPTVHQMVLNLEQLGLIRRTPRKPRSIELLVPPEQLPILR